MGYIQERKNQDGTTSYRAMVRLKGAILQTATFQRKTDAKHWVQEIESSIRAGRHFKMAEAKKHTLGDLIDRYCREVLPTKPKSAKKQLMQLTWWKDQLGFYLLSDITSALISEAKDQLTSETTYRKTKRSPATVIRYLAALSHVFTVAVKEYGWVTENLVSKITKPKEPRGRVRFLSDDERKKLLDECQKSANPYLYSIVVLALSTGMRQGEILNLKWRDVDLKKGRIVLHQTKNGERRLVPLMGLALDLLKKLYGIQKIVSLLIFPSKTDPKKPINIRSAWDQAVKKAGLKKKDFDEEDFVFHSLRHSAASYLAMNGASLPEIAEILGHKSLQMVKRYAHLSDTHVANVVSNMNQKIFG